MKVDENVSVGHVVAAITEGAGAAKAEGAIPKDIPSPSPPQTEAPAVKKHTPSTVSTPSASPTPSSDTSSGRAGSISFPPRRTPSGDIISMMSVSEAKEATEALAKPIRMMEAPKVPNLFIRLPPRPSGPPAPPRKELSDWEIEQIMLGGAGP